MNGVQEFATYFVLFLVGAFVTDRVQANYGTGWFILAVIAVSAIFGLVSTRVKRNRARATQPNK